MKRSSAFFTGTGGNSYSFYVVATSNVGNVQNANTQTAAVTTHSLTPINYWRWENFSIPSNTGVAADTVSVDHDGIPNLLKYGLVIPPGKSGSDMLPSSQVINYTDGKFLSMNFVRDSSRNDITLLVQAANNPGGPWTTVASSVNGAVFTGNGFVSETDAGSGLNTVQVRDVVNTTGASRRFMRVLVTH